VTHLAERVNLEVSVYDSLSSIQKGMYIKEVVVLTVMYNSLFYCAGNPNFLQKSKKEITLLSSHGYKGQRKTNNHTERGA
jgi:hypothetical protein